MKVLIVDDEKIVRHGMLRSVPWENLGIRKVFEAGNGVAALEIFHRERPDILISDIRMPMMDGVALTNEVRRLSAETQIIYLTGHQDMHYIKAALSNNAVDYILKPVDYEELLRVIEKAVRLRRERDGLARLRARTEEKLKESRPFVIRSLLAELVEGTFRSAPEMMEKLAFWNIRLEANARYAVLIVTVNRYRATPVSQREALGFGIEQLLQEVLDRGAAGYAFHLRDENKFVCIVQSGAEERAETDRLLLAIRTTLGEYVPEGVSIAVGAPVDALADVCESYQHAVALLIRRFYESKGGVYDGDPDPVSGADWFSVDKRKLAAFCESMRTLDEASSAEALGDLLGLSDPSRFMSREHLRGAFLLIASHLLASVPGDEIGKDGIDLMSHCAQELSRCENIEEVRAAMENLLCGLRQALSKRPQGQSARVTDEIKAILADRLSTGVTISELSKQVFLTPQYICSVFKQATRMTINEYMTELRVKKARQMLLSGQYKLYEIAPAVGYRDVKYFSRVFKRLTGVSPSEYAEP